MQDILNNFRNPAIAKALCKELSKFNQKNVAIMEVCGTHTMSIFKAGIRSLLPPNIRLISGPGCPVCVTPSSYIATAIKLARLENVIIATFGDLMRVPGGGSSLLAEKAKACDVRMVYSPLDCIKLAEENPNSKVIFLSVGFETTTPGSALLLKKAKERKLTNLFLYSANKTMPEVLGLLAKDEELKIDGFLYPGHVSAITGTAFFEEVCAKYGIPGVVTGFEPVDILQGILLLVTMLQEGRPEALNQYTRLVRKEGNIQARSVVKEVFEPCSAEWRGLGIIESSGLKLNKEFSEFDALRAFGVEVAINDEPKGCRCGEILKGTITPEQCSLFGKACHPQSPVGACMVSSEGTCAAYYRFGRG